MIVIAFTLGAAIVHLNSPTETVEDTNTLTLSSKDIEGGRNSSNELEMSTGNPMQRNISAEKSKSDLDDDVVIPIDQVVTITTAGTKKTELGARLVLKFCIEMSNLCNTIIRWIISTAPFCMGFLIAGSLAQAGSLLDLLQNVGVYVASCMVGMFIHTVIVLPSLLYYYTKLNPYTHIYSCRKALLVALSTASSVSDIIS